MKTSLILLLILSNLLFLSACSNSVDSTEEDMSIGVIDEDSDVDSSALEVDYLDVLKNSEDYDDMLIQVSGEISKVSKSELAFTQGLGYLDAPTSFTMNISGISYNKTLLDSYSTGDYVTVQGVWSHSTAMQSSLKDGEIIDEGRSAQTSASKYESQWELSRAAQAEIIQTVSYMDICNDIDSFDGAYVRITGQVSSIDKNTASNHVFFYFRNSETNSYACSISLKGCSLDMQSSIAEGDYVIVTGQVSDGYYFSLSDCNIESIGAAAEELAQELRDGFYNDFESTRDEFIESCNEYNYDTLARFPDENEGSSYAISGTVVQTDTISGKNVVLLDIGSGNIVYVNYSGQRASDAKILEGDSIEFYGLSAGTKTYLTVLGKNNTIPYFEAIYSNINDYT